MQLPKIKKLIWLDLEMTGLDPDTDKILEIATVLTDLELNVIDEGPEIVVHQTSEVLKSMNGWCINQHNKSGLVQRVESSKVNELEAERLTLDFLKEHVEANTSPMCGNSICQDRRFLYRHMPKLEAFFHYRNLDVSSFKILSQIWAPDFLKGIKKANSHRAKDDILESIEELKYYRKQVLSI